MTGVLAERLRATLQAKPTAIALRASAGDATWQELAGAAERARSALSALGVGAGAVVALAAGTGPEFVAGLLGIALLDAVPAVLDPEDSRLAEEIIDVLRPHAVVLSGGSSLHFEATPTLVLQGLGAGTKIERRDARGVSPRGLEPALACILFTSGTTAAPKGIVWSDMRMRAMLEVRNGANPAEAGVERRIGLFNPMSYAGGFLTTVAAVTAGCTLCLIENPFAVTRAMEAASAFGVTQLSCTPTLVELMLAAQVRIPPSLRWVHVMGSAIPSERLTAFADLLGPVALTKTYGLAETGVVTRLSPEELRRRPETSGTPVPGRSIRILDLLGRDLPPGETGEIVVTLDRCSAADGYFQPSPALAARFRDGTVRTGDQGYIDPDGYLVVGEREAESLKVAGRRVSVARIESVLRKLPEAPQLAVVGIPHSRYGQVPAAIYTPGEPDLERALSEQARRALRADEIPRLLLPRRELAWTAAGKLKRAALAQEACRWSEAWPESIALEGRLWPSTSVGELTAMDGLPANVRAAMGVEEIAPGARAITFVRRQPEVQAVACAVLQDNVSPENAGIRILCGPYVDLAFREKGLERVLMGFLLRLALRLPGPPAVAVIARAWDEEMARALVRLGAVERSTEGSYVWHPDGVARKEPGERLLRPCPYFGMRRSRVQSKACIRNGKYIDVDLGRQTLVLFEDGAPWDAFPFSSEALTKRTKWDALSVCSKLPRAWSSSGTLELHHWLGLDASGELSINELPEWPGARRSEAERSHRRSSRASFRLGIGAAEVVYAWADIGTPVIIHEA